MVFKKYKFGNWKEQIKVLLRKRMKLKDRIKYHRKRIKINQEKINLIKKETLPKLENELDSYLKKAGN